MPMRQAFDRFWAAGSSVQAAYFAAWDVMIARFKDAPGVLGFEPINEPGWGTQDPNTFEATTLSAFYALVAPHMRQLAPRSLVFIDPPGIDGESVSTLVQRPPGDGIVFAPHYYPPRQAADYPALDLPKWAAVGVEWNVPTLVGEFGTRQGAAGAESYISACFAALDTLGMSGTAWEYSVASELWNGETFGFVAADGTDSPTAPALVRPFARAVAGEAIAQSWDETGKTFTLVYTPSSGVTEVQLPSRAFPAGYEVMLSGGCYDPTTVPGRLLVQADDGAALVSLKVVPRG
jgi:endoglycosylceramidase